tara:strand:+ start:369 stop:677 length:309 start_codon:yes stop_codon:yes gene_type:complete
MPYVFSNIEFNNLQRRASPTTYEQLLSLSPVEVMTTLKEVNNNSVLQVKEDSVKALCVICRENIKKHEILRKIVCGHCFHEGCIDQWLEDHNTCPICKYTFI